MQGGVRQRQPLEQSEVVLRGGPCPTPPSPPGLAPLGRQLVAPIGKLFKAEIALRSPRPLYLGRDSAPNTLMLHDGFSSRSGKKHRNINATVRTLTPSILVRIQVPQPNEINSLAISEIN